MNKRIPEHIDPRELVKKALETDKTDIDNLCVLMKQSGSTPWRYVRDSLKKLVKGDYDQAWRMLNYAGEFTGRFYAPGSDEDELYKSQVEILKYTILVLSEEFGKLRPEEE